MKSVPKQPVEKPREEMTLMERIQMRKNQEGGSFAPQQTLMTAHIPKASALNDMSATDREAFQNGSRKRKASLSNSPPKNLQRKQILLKQDKSPKSKAVPPKRDKRPKIIESSEEESEGEASESDMEFDDDDSI